MNNLIQSAKDQIRAKLRDAFNQAVAAGDLSGQLPEEIQVEIPKDRSHGDFASNLCMQCAKPLRMAPRKIADTLLQHMKSEGADFIEECSVAGPGFLNFKLGHTYYEQALREVMAAGEQYGRTDYGQGKKVMVEFVSANPTGPMHIGNARGGALGDTLAAVLDWAGYDVTREFYVNDAGNQVEKFYKSLSIRYKQLISGEDSIQLPEDCYQGADIVERAQEFRELEGDKYLSVADPFAENDPQLRAEFKDKLVTYALEKNIAGLQRDLAHYRVFYDVWFRESSLYAKGEVEETIQMLKDRGYTYEQEGALWLAATRFGCEKDEVLVRANGLCTYFAADIAYHRNKFARGFDTCINVWGADHHGHVARMQGAMNALGLDGSKLEVVLMQLVRLVRGGEAVRMSKRSGKAMSLSDLLEETGVDAARFIFNLQRPDSHLEFDLDLAIQQSSQNPVYYVQYAHARICSILRKLEEEGIPLPQWQQADLSLLTEKEEIDLIDHIASLPEVIRQAAVEREPSKMTRFVIDLAGLFHKFYNACRVNTDDATLREARIVLVQSARTAIANCLRILQVEAPEKM
ncbi:MAG: arginine--tRNA ligase [Eubacteriales bacterium]|jgi:arginyl-tRNA synthetase